MEDTAFEDLHHAAVAGAEGTAWSLPEFAACPPLPLIPTYSTFSATSPFAVLNSDLAACRNETSSPIPIPQPVKEEPVYLRLHPVPSSPPQPSLSSVSSEESHFNAKSASSPLNSDAAVKKETFSKSSTPSASIASSITKPTTITRSASLKRATTSKSLRPQPALSNHDLADLKGTTAARSRKMTEEERRVMLHKRRLRNRASAARSREKRSRTLMDLTAEVEDLMKKSARLAQQANHAVEEARKFKAKNIMLAKENELLRAELKL